MKEKRMNQTLTLSRWVKSGENGTVKIKWAVSIDKTHGKLTSTTKIKVKDVKSGHYSGHVIDWIVNNFNANTFNATNIENSHDGGYHKIKTWINGQTPSNLFIKFENSSSSKTVRAKTVKKGKRVRAKKIKRVKAKKIQEIKVITPQVEFRNIKKKIYKKYELFKKMNNVNKDKNVRKNVELATKYQKLMGMWKELLVFVMDKENIPYHEIPGRASNLEYDFRLLKNHGNIDLTKLDSGYYNVPLKLRMKDKNIIPDDGYRYYSHRVTDPDSIAISDNRNRNGGKNIKFWTYNKLHDFLKKVFERHQSEYDKQVKSIQDKAKIKKIDDILINDVNVYCEELKRNYTNIVQTNSSELINLASKVSRRNAYYAGFHNFLTVLKYKSEGTVPVKFKVEMFGIKSDLIVKNIIELKEVLAKLFFPNIQNQINILNSFKDIRDEKEAKEKK